MSDHLQKKPIKVSGHLEDRRGIYHMVLSWADTNGKRGRKCTSTGLSVKGNKKRAEDMLRAACKEQKNALKDTPDADNILFADFMEQWLETVRSDLKPTTFGGYQMNIQRIIAPYFREKGIRLRELTFNHINEFYAARLKEVTSTTVQRYHNNINKALKYAVELELIDHSPMDKVKRPRAERFVGKHLSESEVIALFNAVRGHRIEFAVILGVFYGLRREEILGLRWESVNFESSTIIINHTVTEAKVDGKKTIVAADTTKTKSSHRTLPMIPIIREKLLLHKAEQEQNMKLCGKSYNKDEGQYVCTDQLGNRIKPGYLTSAFPKFMEDQGFRRVRLHDLRHSCASIMLANGISMKQIQEWMGHSTFNTTADIYTHLEYNSKLEAANSIKWIEQTNLGQMFSAEPQ